MKEERRTTEKEEQQKETEKKMEKDNIIFIGDKPFMNYVTSVIMQLTTEEADRVMIKARGKFISRAVDVAEVAKKRFLKDQAEIKQIKTDSEEFTNDKGKEIRVSTIDITIEKKEKQ